MDPNFRLFLDYPVFIVISGGQIAIVAFNMTKAFDKVNQDFLLYKLPLYDFLQELPIWYQAYPTCHQSSVRISNIYSLTHIPTSREVQGSNLLPLSFLFLVNDLEVCINNSVLLMPADDIKICRICTIVLSLAVSYNRILLVYLSGLQQIP